MVLFVNWHLLGDEKPIHESRVSWKIYGLYYLFGILLIVLGIALPFIVGPRSPIRPMITSIVFASLGVILIIMARMKSRKELVMLTTERLLIRKKVGKGLFKSTNIEALALNKIDDVQIHQTFFQKLIGIGDIHFRISGQEHTLEDVDNPQGLEQAIYKVLEKEKETGSKKS